MLVVHYCIAILAYLYQLNILIDYFNNGPTIILFGELSLHVN